MASGDNGWRCRPRCGPTSTSRLASPRIGTLLRFPAQRPGVSRPVATRPETTGIWTHGPCRARIDDTTCRARSAEISTPAFSMSRSRTRRFGSETDYLHAAVGSARTWHPAPGPKDAPARPSGRQALHCREIRSSPGPCSPSAAEACACFGSIPLPMISDHCAYEDDRVTLSWTRRGLMATALGLTATSALPGPAVAATRLHRPSNS